MENLDNWTGEQKIVFSVDIGTTHSAVSFLYLEPGKAPQVNHVARWPGHQDEEKAKTSTAIYYDKTGKPCSFGLETETTKIKERAEKDGWLLVHSFKRHVHKQGTVVDTDIPDDTDVLKRPHNVSIELLYTHWLTFLFKHAQAIFVEKFGRVAWDKLSPGMELIFTVPNGWYTQEHGLLTRAVIAAHIVKNDSQVSFVPETEAAVHWALFQGELELSNGMNFIVCDSGGSTTDIALYNIARISPLQLQERQGFPSKCIEAGSALIDHSFGEMVGQMFADDQDGDQIVGLAADARELFEKEKRDFDASKETYVFPIQTDNGGKNFPDGHLEVPCDDVSKLFDKEIEKIVAGINELRANNNPKYLLLLGDFGHSPYFQDKLRDEYDEVMTTVQAGVKRVKAGAGGALIWFLKHGVVARAARFAFGQQILVPFNPNDKEHVARGSIQRTDGDWVKYGWDRIVSHGKLLKDGQEHKRSYQWMFTSKDASLSNFATTVYTADETASNTKWVRDREGKLVQGFEAICEIKADVSSLQGKLPMKNGPRGPYWYLSFEVAVDFGSTSPQARILWKENGKPCTGPATLIPAKFV